MREMFELGRRLNASWDQELALYRMRRLGIPREFLGSLMEAAAESDVTVLLSSHLVTDLERACDYLILLSASRIQVLGEVERLLAEHKILTGPRTDREEVAGVSAVVSARYTERQSPLFVRAGRPVLKPT